MAICSFLLTYSKAKTLKGHHFIQILYLKERNGTNDSVLSDICNLYRRKKG
jgi:hypothetical protein